MGFLWRIFRTVSERAFFKRSDVSVNVYFFWGARPRVHDIKFVYSQSDHSLHLITLPVIPDRSNLSNTLDKLVRIYRLCSTSACVLKPACHSLKQRKVAKSIFWNLSRLSSVYRICRRCRDKEFLPSIGSFHSLFQLFQGHKPCTCEVCMWSSGVLSKQRLNNRYWLLQRRVFGAYKGKGNRNCEKIERNLWFSIHLRRWRKATGMFHDKNRKPRSDGFSISWCIWKYH